METWIMRNIAAAFFLVCCATGSVVAADAKFTHGPILGRLSDSGVGVWARLSQPGEFYVEYWRQDQGPADKKRSKTALAALNRDNTGWVEVQGLKPNAKYVYQLVTAAGTRGLGGVFRTLPNPEDYRDPELNPRGLFNFNFEFACGNNQHPDHGLGPTTPTFKTMLDKLRDRVHFSIQNGDWLYEEQREFTPAQWAKQVGIGAKDAPPVVQTAPTIVGVWENYKTYLDRGKNMAAYHRHVPTFFTFDDHEILNDVWGAGSPGLRDRRAVYRDVGVQAWYDYLGWSNPVKFKQGIHFGRTSLKKGDGVLTDPKADFTNLDLEQAGTLHVHWGGATAGVNDNALDEVGGDPNAGVYEIVEILDKNRLKISPVPKDTTDVTYSIGRRSYYRLRVSNCDFFVTDTRSHREMHDTKQPDKPGLSILGPRQKKWLLDGMKSSDADFLFVVSSVNFMIPHVGGGKVRATNKDDAWTVFFDEREQLIQAFDKIGKPVMVLTGDLHNSFVIKITDRVWECASGPHNSNNHWS
ncbi:MAG: alkaline phosphatase D family protein, partial [Planctomycetales bacterium]